MTEFAVISFPAASEWQTWLSHHFDDKIGIWLRIYKKTANKPTVTYAEALDEALCVGWIDGQKKKFDADSWLQQFGPRRSRSVWSKINTIHIARLEKAGRMKPSGLAVVAEAKADGRWDNAYEGQSTATLPEDFAQELHKNRKAQEFYESLNKVNKYAIMYRLNSAKKEDTRQKRMAQFIEMLEKEEKLYP